MRDISTRIQRYRLSRYAAPGSRGSHRLRWALVIGALWLVWAGFVSDHSFLRLWQLSGEDVRSASDLKRLEGEIHYRNVQVKDPAEQRELAEHALREKAGMARRGEIIYRVRRDPPEKR